MHFLDNDLFLGAAISEASSQAALFTIHKLTLLVTRAFVSHMS